MRKLFLFPLTATVASQVSLNEPGNGIATHLSADLYDHCLRSAIAIQKSVIRSLSFFSFFFSRYTGRLALLCCRRRTVAGSARPRGYTCKSALIRARGSLISWCAVCAVRCSTRVSSSQRGVPSHRGACAPSRRDHRSATAARLPCALDHSLSRISLRFDPTQSEF